MTDIDIKRLAGRTIVAVNQGRHVENRGLVTLSIRLDDGSELRLSHRPSRIDASIWPNLEQLRQ